MKAIRMTREKGAIFFLTILFHVGVTAQTVDSVVHKFDRYSAQHLQEKVFVHTDKSFYLVGEVVWFKVYVTDAVFNKPSDISKISYVEILTKDSKPVLQGKIDMNYGSGNGSFMLPSFLATGNYTLRAYTNWMRNIPAEYYFEKSITIVNSLKNAGFAASNTPALNISFFPEGGQMVNGLPTVVAFRMTNENGAGINGIGYLLNQNNDTLVRFLPGHFGIGKFSFTPKKGNQYKALVRFGDKMVIRQLPAVLDEGYVMKLSEVDTTRLKISVNSNIPSNNSAYLFVHTRNRFKAMVQQKMVNGEASFMVDKKMLDHGINHLTVFNRDRQPVCERLYFKRPSKKLDIDIGVKQTSFPQRTKVDLEVITHQQQANIPDADLSVSAFLLDSLQRIDEPGILSYLLLTSDLAGSIESADWYLNNNNPESEAGIDNLMLTHGWRRFKWEEILQDQKPYFEFLPELEGTVVTGKVLDKRTGSPANNITAFLSVPGQNFQFASAVSNSKGELLFNVRKFYGSNELIAQTNYMEDSNYRIDLMSPFSDKFSNHPPSQLALASKWKEQLQNRNLNAQVENAYLKQVKQQFSLPVDADTSHFYGKPDKRYYLDDYTRFTTMEEVMREFVAEVRVRRQSAFYNFKVKRPNSLSFFDSDPLVLLDGVPVFNVNKIMETDPLKIKKIDIINHKYYSGSHVTDGIISYSSYDGDLGGYKLDPNSLIVEYEGLQREREFYSPDYTTPEKLNSRIPDFRNVLYWSPTVKTNETGRHNISFFTSDVPGKYAILVQGITREGLAGSKIVTFDIEDK
ncbi:MAG: hypothetical protein JWR18_1826 [Segetibacter sp.]|nr:hypothetical protein [Segetibacter sp.]